MEAASGVTRAAPRVTVPAGLLSGVLAVITTLGTVWVLILQQQSAGRIAELKAASDKQENTLQQVHVLTNTNFTEQKAQILALVKAAEAKDLQYAHEIQDMRATITRLETLIGEQHKAEKK